MSYVEAIEYQSPLQVQAHRERMERLRRLGADTPKQVISFRPKPVAVAAEPPQKKGRDRFIPSMASDKSGVVVSGVNITADPAVGLMPVSLQKKIAPIATIQKIVCSRYGITMAEMNGKGRPLKFVVPRQIAMYLCRKVTSRSLPEIGRKFGGRDHTTVLHGVCKVEALMAESSAFNAEIQAIISVIEQD